MSARTSDARKRERRKHYRHLSQIYALCRSGEWRFRFARLIGGGRECARLGLVNAKGKAVSNVQGTVDWENQVIVVDPREDMLMTFVHECLHVLHTDRFGPDGNEAEEHWVRDQEALIKRHLTAVQATRLLELMTLMLEEAAAT